MTQQQFLGTLKQLPPNAYCSLFDFTRRPVAWLMGLCLLLSTTLVLAAPGFVSAAANLATARYQHTATLLPNGKVLVAGGYNNGALASAELYDRATNIWTTAAALATARNEHTSTLLANGKVLVAGGYNNGALASTELYDPATNTWSFAGTLATARYFHTATLLSDGRVLVAGGGDNGVDLGGVELYDPASNTWTAASPLATARLLHSATLLQNGKVLVAGGFGNAGTLASAELYDPLTNVWTTTGSLATARNSHAATRLQNGKVLVVGRSGGSDAGPELYNPQSNEWTAAGTLTPARYGNTATLLANGSVLAVGGFGAGGALAGADLYDPATNAWTAATALGTARYVHTATLLPNGNVLIAGGADNGVPIASAELFDFDNQKNYSDSWWNANESGWGLNITDHGSNLFIQWFTYDETGHNQKYVIAGGTFTNGKCQFSGVLKHVTGPSWSLATFDSTQVVTTTAGSATLDFCPTGLAAGTIVFNYTADQITGAKQLTRLPFGNDVPHWAASTNAGEVDYTDLWWNPNESGWGVSITQHGNNAFARIYVYDADNRPLVFIVPNVTFTTPNRFNGSVFLTSGPWFGSIPFDPNQVVRTNAGTATFAFSDSNNGVLSYTINGITRTKTVTRLSF